MKAFVLPDETSSATFQEIDTPEPDRGEVRIAVKASSVNGFDVFVASGMARGMMEHRYPVVLGKDFAGVVDAVGDGVDRFTVGDEVAGIMPPAMHVGDGAYAEFISVPAEGFIQPKPASLSFEQAASVGLAALAADVAITATNVSDGNVVLVTGATGGVGTYAVQLAAARGAHVIATGRPEDEEWIRSLGATEVLDYTGDVAAAVRAAHPEGIDALIDAVNRGDDHGAVAALVKEGGFVASTTGSADEEGLRARRVGGVNVMAQGDPSAFSRVLEMAGDGRLQVPVTETFSFDQLPNVLGLVGSRSSRGKFAVRIAER
jgi:NADPH:quinone reductase-like Zn-dependent oxidoreductase